MTETDIQKIRRDAVNEFAQRLVKYYSLIPGSTNAALVAYHVDKVKDDMFPQVVEYGPCECSICREKQ